MTGRILTHLERYCLQTTEKMSVIIWLLLIGVMQDPINGELIEGCLHPLHNIQGRQMTCAFSPNSEPCPDRYNCVAHPADHWINCCPDEPTCLLGMPLIGADKQLVKCDASFNKGCPYGFECVDGHCCQKQAGTCPKYTSDVYTGTCETQCGGNVFCPSGHICCKNGCGQECIPNKPAPQCPYVDGILGACVEECSSNSDCDAGKICCANGCGHTCMNPSPPAEAICGGVFCGEGDKCVPQCIISPCDPLPACINTTDPCMNKDCGAGKRCIAKMVVCVTTPCDPVAECIQDERVCMQPHHIGPCLGHMEKWFFNSTVGKCEKFVYGGCEGNDNRFDTADACVKTCGGPMPQVENPKSTGGGVAMSSASYMICLLSFLLMKSIGY